MRWVACRACLRSQGPLPRSLRRRATRLLDLEVCSSEDPTGFRTIASFEA